jgi:hypothetical protein
MKGFNVKGVAGVIKREGDLVIELRVLRGTT